MAKVPKKLRNTDSSCRSEASKRTRSFVDARMKQQLFDEKWLANRWGCSVSYIRKLRYNGEGPLVIFTSGMVRYRLSDVRAYERGRRFKSRSDYDQWAKKQR